MHETSLELNYYLSAQPFIIDLTLIIKSRRICLGVYLHLVTARVRSIREGTVFTGVCLSTFRSRGVYPIRRPGGGTHYRFRQGGTPSSWWGGYPILSPGGGVPHPVDWGYPIPGPGGGYPIQLTVPPVQDWMRYPLSRTGWGTPPCPRLDGVPPPPVRRQSSIASSTCYVAGGMPLAFTQEDFLMICGVFLRMGVMKKYTHFAV